MTEERGVSEHILFHEPPSSVQLPSRDVEWFHNDAVQFPTPQEVRAASGDANAETAFTPRPVRFPALGLIVKWGEDVTIAEGQCLWFFGTHLAQDVPVPTIYGWRRDGNQTFLYMELIQGDTLEERWPSLSLEEKVATCAELGTIASRWRSMKRPPDNTKLSQLGGQALRDIMFHDAGNYPAGPFPDTASFHKAFASLALRKSLSGEDPRSQYEELQGLDDSIEVVFTHNDLDQSNILVSRMHDGPIRVLAIIDWHQSGWYPEHWERLKAQSVAWPKSEWAEEYIAKFLPPADFKYYYSWEYVRMATI